RHFANCRLVRLERHLRKSVKRKHQVEGFGSERNVGHRRLSDFLKSALTHPLESVHRHVKTVDIAASGGSVVFEIETGAASRVEDTKVWFLKFAGSYRIGNLPDGDKPPVFFFEVI